MSLLKKKYIRQVKGISIFSLLLLFVSCELEDKMGKYTSGDNPVEVELVTRNITLGGSESGVTLKRLRVIAVAKNSGKVEMNRRTDLSAPSSSGLEHAGGVFKLYLRPGDYDLFVIGNETTGMNSALTGEPSLSEIKSVPVTLPADTTEFVVCKHLDIRIRNSSSSTPVTGEVSVDEGLTWNSAFSVELERIASKASLEIRKNTDEDIKIRQVTVKQLPSFSFLSPSAYPLSGGLTVTDMRSFSTPVSIAGEKDVPSGYSYTSVVQGKNSFILPEYIWNNTAGKGRASFMEIEAERNGVSETWQILLGKSTDIPADYSLGRNTYYRYMLTVNPLNVDVNVSVEPWQNTAAYDTIPGAKIVFSRVNVGYSYASESAVTFTTKNLPPVSVSLSPVLYAYNSTGDPVSSKFDMTRTKINYSYDQDTGTGMGTLTIKRNKVSLADTLLLMAGGFAHTIAVEGVEFAGSNIYFDRVLEKFTFDDTPAPGCRAEHEKFQGASFYWGSLQGNNTGYNFLATHKNDRKWGYISIPVWISAFSVVGGDDENLILQKGLHDPKNLKGDICRFITQREWGPGNKRWRMPTLDELKLLGDGIRETTASIPSWGYISGSSSEGSTVIGNGIRTNNRYYLPANENGLRGRYWSASAAISASARGLYFEYLSTSIQDWITSSGDGAIRCVVDSENNYPKIYRVVYSNTNPLNQENNSYSVPPPALLNEGETITLPALSTKFNDYEVREGGKVVTKYSHTGWLVNGRHFDFGDSYVIGTDGAGNTEVEIIPEWTKLCKIEYVCTPPYPGAVFYWRFSDSTNFVEMGEKHSLLYVVVAVNSSPVKMCTGLLVNGDRYRFGDEIVVSTDVKIEPYWVNTPETPFASTNLELSNPGSTDATLIFAPAGSKGTGWSHSVANSSFPINGVTIPSLLPTDYDKNARLIHSVEGLKRGVGDVCRLVGIPLNEINAKLAAGELPDNKTWRLPDIYEMAALLHPYQDSSEGRFYPILNTYFPYYARYIQIGIAASYITAGSRNNNSVVTVTISQGDGGITGGLYSATSNYARCIRQ